MLFFFFFFFQAEDGIRDKLVTGVQTCALPIYRVRGEPLRARRRRRGGAAAAPFWRERLVERSEEHTSELQSLAYLVCRLLLEKKKKETIDGPNQAARPGNRPD